MGTDTHEQGKGKSKRGSVDNKSRLSEIMGQGSGQRGKADWGGARADWIQAVIIAVCNVGGAASFGYSRDGNAHSLSIMLDGDRTTLWFNGDADLDAELEQVFHKFETS